MSGAWPAWATEPVQLSPADRDWAGAAEELIAALAPVLAGCADRGIHHVGSTAVPGLEAKPTLDLMAGLEAIEDAPGLDQPLAALRWHLIPPDLDGRPWRRTYVLPDGDHRRAHLHLVASRHPRFTQTLTFRDCLRRDHGLAQRYAMLKRELARAHPTDREAYTTGKSAFVQEVLAAAGN